MAWYRREKLVLNGFRSLASRTRGVPKNPTFQYGYLNLNLASRGDSFNGFSSLCSISQRLGTRGVVGGVNRNFHNPFLLRAKNIHNVPYSLPPEARRWLESLKHDPMKFLYVFTCGVGLLGLVYWGKLETIPFTKRNHFVLDTCNAEWKFKEKKKFYEGRILPYTHPESVRATMIGKDIIDALHRGLGKEQLGSDLWYASAEKAMLVEGDDGTETFMSKEKGQESVSQSETSHFDKWNWEIIVVNEPTIWATCLAGGKIFVSAGSFKHFKSDAEIATMIGHEVAHAVANHREENSAANFFYAFMTLLLWTKFRDAYYLSLLLLLLAIYYCFRDCFCEHFATNEMEIEADYIGLQLLALASYDPRVAPGVYERLGKMSGESTEPLKRNRTLPFAQAMEDALIIYNDVREGMVSAISGASSAPSSAPSSYSS